MDLPKWTERVPDWRLHCEAVLERPYWEKSHICPIRYIFDWRMTRKAGEYSGTIGRFHTIKLSPWMKEEEARHTFVHEFCHLLAFICYGEEGHGKSWQSFMLAMGEKPEVFHEYPLDVRCTLDRFCEVTRKLKNVGRPG